jgi:hypothetical protein
MRGEGSWLARSNARAEKPLDCHVDETSVILDTQIL